MTPKRFFSLPLNLFDAALSKTLFAGSSEGEGVPVPGCANQADLASVDLELMECKRQPGRLRLSRQACARRYLMAQKVKPEIPNDEFGMARKAGLSICRDCPDGRKNSKGIPPV